MKYLILLFLGLFFCATYAPIYTDATLTGDGTTDSPLGVSRGSEITPDTIKADQDNYTPDGVGIAEYIYLISDNQWAITGITDSVAGTLQKYLVNTGLFTIFLYPQHPDSDAAHRFADCEGVFPLHPGKVCEVVYDQTASRWRIIGEIRIENSDVNYEWSGGSVAALNHHAIEFSAFSGSITATPASTTLPAHALFSTLTSSSGTEIGYLVKSMENYSAFGSAHMVAECLLSIPTLSDGTETFTSEFQITPNSSLSSIEYNNSIGLRYSHGINTGEWELFSQNNSGTESTSDSGIPVAISTLYRLRLEVNKSNTEAVAFINGVYVGRVTTNLPNNVATGVRIIHKKSAGTTARTLAVYNFKAGAIYQ